jgi:hypothetical protein
MDFVPTLAFVKSEIEREIAGRPQVPKGFLAEFVDSQSGLSSMMDEELKSKVVRHLEAYFWAQNSNGHTLSTNFESWYPERKLSEGFENHYWPRLEKYWHDHAVIPRNSIRSTDYVTNEVMDFLGDPQNEDSWLRRGLVMGHVQSGKTTNYSALIAKAADAGYRIIIVLSGLTNSLRKQTQIRLDKTFVGKSSLGDDVNNEFYPISRVMSGVEGYVFRSPFCGTTQLKDFNVATLRGIGASEGNFAEPILFVTKKQVGILERLATWLSNLKEGGVLDGPMLVIDDEADNASVNTTDNEVAVTRTNERIRRLLMCSRRASYVGYTATPFANIFIHPDSSSEMLGDNLFPEHFIKSLDPPGNYVGARDLFLEGGRLNDICVREIPDDYQDILPLRHKSNHVFAELPGSLKKAVYQYFLFRAIRYLDKETDSHSSMLINVSRFNLVQNTIYELVDDLRVQVKQHADAWAKSDSWRKSESLLSLSETWVEEYDSSSKYSWDDIRGALASAIEPITPVLVNMRGVALDYSDRKDRPPLHVIAIGGLALARGLTLEGLAISYVLRNVGAGDTLLQLGRWFGYRPGYEHLCRMYLTEDMISHFEHVSESVEELRDDLVRMKELGRTPGEFGLKVRESPTGIAITAANKMRSAEAVLLAANYQEKHVQAYEIFDDVEKNSQHLESVKVLKETLMDDYAENYSESNGAMVWQGVPSSLVIELLEKMDLPQIEFSAMNNGGSLLSDYIRDRAAHNRSLDKWTIAIPFARSQATGVDRLRFPIPLLSEGEAYCRQRLSGVQGNGNTVKITQKNVVADLPRADLVHGEDSEQLKEAIRNLRLENPEERITDERGYLACREQSLLLVHIFQFQGKHPLQANLANGEPAVSVSVGLNSTNFTPRERLYAASVRLIEQLRALARSSEDDDVVTDDY